MRRRDESFVFPAARRDAAAGYLAHGQFFADPYAWLEQLDSAETQQWVAAQEELTQGILQSVSGAEWLRKTVERASRYARLSPPIFTTIPGLEFFWQADANDEKQRLMFRRDAHALPEVVLDPNTWSAHEVLVFAVPSPDGRFVAFGTSLGSAHQAMIQILEVASGQLLPDRPRGTHHSSLAWRPDSSGFFYAACPDPGETPAGEEAYWEAIYEHRLGSAAPARRIFGDDLVKEYWCAVKLSECGRFALLYKWDYVHANVVYLLRLADELLIPVAPDMHSINQVQLIGDRLLITTDRDAPRGRLCWASLDAPTVWHTLIAEQSDTLQTATGAAGHLYAVYSHNASHRVDIYSPGGEYLRELRLPGIGAVNRNEGSGVISGISGAWQGNEVWVHFASYVQPASYYRYEYASDQLIPYYVPEVGIDPAQIETNQVWYDSPDGTAVSMFLVQQKGQPRDGKRHVRLNGYGGFNISLEPRFAPINVVWLQLGGMLAFANIRGGGEYGRDWHEAARKTRRQNAFDDYIAAARWLVSAGYTTSEQIISRGNSNGGLLVAVTAMQAPDAFGAVYCRAPTLDMLSFPRFGHLGSAVVEYGSPDDPIEGPYLAGYSPYHTIQAERVYPTILFVSALNDRVAPPYDPLKMVARLQAENTRGGPYLLLPLRASGHGGGTTLSALITQDAAELAFYCWALGLSPGEGVA